MSWQRPAGIHRRPVQARPRPPDPLSMRSSTAAYTILRDGRRPRSASRPSSARPTPRQDLDLGFEQPLTPPMGRGSSISAGSRTPCSCGSWTPTAPISIDSSARLAPRGTVSRNRPPTADGSRSGMSSISAPPSGSRRSRGRNGTDHPDRAGVDRERRLDVGAGLEQDRRRSPDDGSGPGTADVLDPSWRSGLEGAVDLRHQTRLAELALTPSVPASSVRRDPGRVRRSGSSPSPSRHRSRL